MFNDARQFAERQRSRRHHRLRAVGREYLALCATQRAVLKLYRNTRNTEDGARQLTQALRPLDLPALVIWGAHDPYISVKFAERQREVFPRAEIAVLSDSGHWPFVDNPQAVAQALLPFLRRQLQRN